MPPTTTTTTRTRTRRMNNTNRKSNNNIKPQYSISPWCNPNGHTCSSGTAGATFGLSRGVIKGTRAMVVLAMASKKSLTRLQHWGGTYIYIYMYICNLFWGGCQPTGINSYICQSPFFCAIMFLRYTHLLTLKCWQNWGNFPPMEVGHHLIWVCS